MKVLEIKNEKCFYSVDGKMSNSIVDIGKDDIYKILNLIYENQVDMDTYSDDVKINNEVEKLIYKEIYTQLTNFQKNISVLKKEIEEEFRETYEKYNSE